MQFMSKLARGDIKIDDEGNILGQNNMAEEFLAQNPQSWGDQFMGKFRKP